jgi:hypothetical protein
VSGSAAAIANRSFWKLLWDDIQPPVKAMVGDAVLFVLGLAILAVSFLGLVLLERLHYPKEHIYLLMRLHFWCYYAVLTVLFFDLIFKVISHAFRKK